MGGDGVVVGEGGLGVVVGAEKVESCPWIQFSCYKKPADSNKQAGDIFYTVWTSGRDQKRGLQESVSRWLVGQ